MLNINLLSNAGKKKKIKKKINRFLNIKLWTCTTYIIN